MLQCSKNFLVPVKFETQINENIVLKANSESALNELLKLFEIPDEHPKTGCQLNNEVAF